jgi:hypothetical protein
MLTEYVNALLDARNLLNQGLAKAQPMLVDITIPLDTRWDAYTNLVEADILVKEMNYGTGYLDDIFGHNSVSLYDDFYMDRGQSRTFPEIWEAVTEKDDDEIYADVVKQDAWREKVLASGYAGFNYDW